MKCMEFQARETETIKPIIKKSDLYIYRALFYIYKVKIMD